MRRCGGCLGRAARGDKIKKGSVMGEVQKFAVVWYQPASWPELKATAADADAIEDTYKEWLANAESSLAELLAQGMRLEKMVIDIDALLAWRLMRGIAPDVAARAEYAAHLLRQRDQGRTSEA